MNVRPVILGLVVLVAVPLVVRLALYGTMPDGWGTFPPPRSPQVPGFDWRVFALGLALAVPILRLLLAPRGVGFTPGPARAAEAARVGLPGWFWPGAALCLVFFGVMSGAVTGAGRLVHYCFVPMWWGLIMALDGLVYRRTGGVSLLSRRPGAMLAIAATSCVCWYYFEYLNYFVLANWYYPHDEIFSQTGYVLWFALAYTTVMPAVFEFYNLLTTWPRLRARWASGPRLALSPEGWRWVARLGAGSLACLVVWPAPLFPLLWLGPLMLLAGVMMRTGRWTPFTPLARGNWSPLVLMGLACVATYVLGEAWNWLSTPDNPNFWKYDVPYVNVLHVFEMPALGYFGYLPFAWVCWLWWGAQATLLGLDPAIDVAPGMGPRVDEGRGLSVPPRG